MNHNTTDALYRLCPALKEADRLIEEAYKIVREQLITEARKVLRESKVHEEFVCGMGSAFFTRNDGEFSDMHYEVAQAGLVTDLLLRYDESMNLTGDPMCFTADGEIVADW